MLNNNNDTEKKLTQPIFNNKLLIDQGTPLFNKQSVLSNMLWVKDLFINDRFITREEFNNTVGAGATNFMNYNLLRTVVLHKVNRNDRLGNYDQEPKKKHLKDFQQARFPETNLNDRNTISPKLLGQEISNVCSQRHVVHSIEKHQGNQTENIAI